MKSFSCYITAHATDWITVEAETQSAAIEMIESGAVPLMQAEFGDIQVLSIDEE